MNRIEVAVSRQVSAGAITPLEPGTGIDPVACTPVTFAAISLAAAVCAYYAIRDCGAGYMELDGNVDMGGMERGADQMSVGDLTDVMRSSTAR
ncbi:hypothetical protein [Amycolatopsis sp. H20-H5]|uniref:hypothetical protein n=1 Tax=Amycolatopsis sp. H20-H5 TaxID=3046309 RepID=UPI002DC0015C|nr:hypothetical protein [Amycolatopsis sp. H20-H5]